MITKINLVSRPISHQFGSSTWLWGFFNKHLICYSFRGRVPHENPILFKNIFVHNYRFFFQAGVLDDSEFACELWDWVYFISIELSKTTTGYDKTSPHNPSLQQARCRLPLFSLNETIKSQTSFGRDSYLLHDRIR